MTTKPPMLEIDTVSVSKPNSGFDSKAAGLLIDKVSCQVNEGEILAVIGPNGAGKSTLLKAVAGDLAYTGSIQIKGLENEAKLRARQVAVLPQLSLLNFPYRVSEVVALSRIPHNTGRQRDQEIVNEALHMMDINFLADRLYTELSGGEKQRVQLARVLAQIWQVEDAPSGTRLLLLDEPTGALDLGHQQQLMRAIQNLASQGVAIMMVLHDVNLAAQYADTMLALLCSQRIAFGAVNEVVTPQNMTSLFGIHTQIIAHPEYGTPVVIGL